MKSVAYNSIILLTIIFATVSWYTINNFEVAFYTNPYPGKGSGADTWSSPFFFLVFVTALLLLARRNFTTKMIQKLFTVLLFAVVIVDVLAFGLILYMAGTHEGNNDFIIDSIRNHPIRYLHFVPWICIVLLFMLLGVSRPRIKPDDITK